MNAQVWMNGTLLPSNQATVPIADRSWMYGDGLFETLRIHQGRPFRWNDHWSRWTAGAAHIRLSMPYSEAIVLAALYSVIESNQVTYGIARLHLSRGSGVRGYSIQNANSPTLIITATRDSSHSQNRSVSLFVSSVRLPSGDPLGRFKTASKLPIILAQIEAEEAGATAALVMDTNGIVAETTRGNLFWIDVTGKVLTPPLSTGALDGVTRTVVTEICRELDLPFEESRIEPPVLFDQAGAFVTSSGFGLAPVTTLNGCSLPLAPLFTRLESEYRARLDSEK